MLEFKHSDFSNLSDSFPTFFFTWFSLFQVVKIRIGFDGDILKCLVRKALVNLCCGDTQAQSGSNQGSENSAG